MNNLWIKLVEKAQSKIANMTFLMVGLTTTCKGKVKADAEDKKSVEFTLRIDWSECTFAHVVALAMRTVRIDEQAKMRKNGMPKQNEIVTVSVNEKQTKTVSLGRVSGMFDKLSDEDKMVMIKRLSIINK
jgi:hypothetical protein